MDEKRKYNGGSLPTFLQACEMCDENLVRQYIHGGATVEQLNERDRTGKTGLSHACASGFVTIVSLLRLPTIDVNMGDNEGNTPLIFAAQAGHGDIVSVLLNYFPGIDVDKANKQGFTALMKAAIQGRARCAKLLLYAGASLMKRDSGRGLCALEWAEYCNRQTCAKTISQFAEACSLGIMCSSLWQRSSAGQLAKNKWKSDSSLNDPTEVSCLPTKLFHPHLHMSTRKSLSTGPPEHHYSAISSLEEVARCLYSPVFPEHLALTGPIPTNSHSTGGGSKKKGKTPINIPKVEITLTSKDDNFYFENALPFRNSGYKYKQYSSEL